MMVVLASDTVAHVLVDPQAGDEGFGALAPEAAGLLGEVVVEMG